MPETSGRLKKRVSFEKDVTGGTNGALNGETGALVRTETDDMAIDDSRSSTAPNGLHKGNELAAVPEDRESEAVFSRKKTSDSAKPDPKPGDYWMKPTRAELRQAPRDKLQNFRNFEVGRVGCGKVVFNDPVDLTQVSLDDLYENIIEIRLRSVTVYPDGTKKPKQGQGLNVPSTISIENSWPRSRGQVSSITSGPAFDKHVNRLKKMGGTQFLNYEPATGVWTFKVPHYTRYGLDYDEDAEMDESMLPSDVMEETTPRVSSPDGSEMDSGNDDSDMSPAEDDTFAFKQKIVPGGFDRTSSIAYNVSSDEDASEPSDMAKDETPDNEVSMAGTFPDPEAPVFSPAKSVLRPRIGTPGKPLLDLDGDWADQLARTISPRKQNRETLREAQSKILLDRVYEPMKPQRNVDRSDFRNSMDLMNSLFGKYEKGKTVSKRQETAGQDFEV